MELTGQRSIAAPRAVVWDALNDPAILRDCIPGCQTLDGSTADGFTATVKQKVGPVTASFTGSVTVSDAVPPERYRIAGAGKGGVAGFAKGHADVVLTETADGTDLSYAVQAKVGGKIAQLGSRVVDSFAAKMADAFFAAFKDRVEQAR